MNHSTMGAPVEQSSQGLLVARNSLVEP